MNKDKSKIMTFRAPYSMWLFLKQMSMECEEPVNAIMLRCLEQFKKSQEKIQSKKKEVDMQ